MWSCVFEDRRIEGMSHLAEKNRKCVILAGNAETLKECRPTRKGDTMISATDWTFAEVELLRRHHPDANINLQIYQIESKSPSNIFFPPSARHWSYKRACLGTKKKRKKRGEEKRNAQTHTHTTRLHQKDHGHQQEYHSQSGSIAETL